MRTRLALTAAVLVIAALLGAAPQSVPATEAAGPGTWSSAASMPYARYAHTSTLLPKGKVLVTGGAGGVIPFNWETAIYNRTTNTWEPSANMLYARSVHQATLLRDGRVLVTGGWNHGADGRLAEIYTPGTDTWTSTPLMNYAHSAHTSTLLPDGRVLVTGGDPNIAFSGFTSHTAEIYDPVLNTWTPAASMAEPRSRHAAVLLDDGRVVVAGGSGAPEIYDPSTNLWSLTTAPPGSLGIETRGVRMADGRVLFVHGIEFDQTRAAIFDPLTNESVDTYAPSPGLDFTLTLLGNGHVAILGQTGPSGRTPKVQLFDPESTTWSNTASMSIAKTWAATTLLATGELLVTGGNINGSDIYTAVSELYDPSAWVPVAAMSTPRPGLAGVVLFDGRALVGGSGTAEVYSPATNAWTPTGPMTEVRRYHAMRLLPNGKVIAIGGFTPTFSPLTSTEIYDPATNAWSAGPPLPVNGGFTRAVNLAPGSILAFMSDASTVSSSAVYNAASNTWGSPHTGLPAQITGTLDPIGGGRAIVTGGYATFPDQTPIATTRIYDITTDTWTDGSGMGHARSGHTSVARANGRVVVIGGSPDASTAEEYNPATNTWSPLASMADERLAASATLLDSGAILVAGGQDPVSITAILDSAELLAPTGGWSNAGPINDARREHLALRLPDGSVLIIGGWDSDPVPQHHLVSAERYDLGIHTDTDGDGYNDGLELALGQHPWLSCKTMRADVSGDGTVNAADLGRVAAQTGKRPPPSRIDQNGDKVINAADLGLTASQSGKSVLMCA